MEQNKNLSTEPGKTSGNNPTVGSSGRSSSPTANTPSTQGSSAQNYSGQSGSQTASAPQRARETAQAAFEQTKQVVNDAYGKTSEVLSNTYEQAMTYGRENPGKLTLIAFGAGIGIGILLASGFGGRSRTNRIAEPIVGALSQVAMEFFR
jgi:ElaB/YqjD/DUF883 family membrane-anchored ribosome-binding protein